MEIAIVLNGSSFNRKIDEPFIICADGGYKLLKDRKPDLLVGDMDSVGTVPEGVKVLTVPSHKNFSDGELAVREACRMGAEKIALYGAEGGRLDHFIVNLSLLVLACSLGVEAIMKTDNADIFYQEESFEFNTKKGQIFSLLPLGRRAVVARAENVEYPLENLELTAAGMSRGLSNIATSDKVSVELAEGALFVFLNF